jgi:serine protease Do
LRQLASAVHQQSVLDDLLRELDQDESSIDLFHAALLIARLDSEEVDVEAYRRQFARLADECTGRLPADADDEARLKAVNDYLFVEGGFHGSRGDYYNRRNSYVNEVLDDREGLPITLSVVYIELARRAGLDVVGVGLPGHFVVEFRPKQGVPRIIDVFEQGESLTREQVDERVRGFTGQPPTAEQLRPVDKRAILVRIVRNLQSIAGRRQDLPGVMRYLDAILAIVPDSAEDRMFRAFYRYRSGQDALALEDLDWLIEHRPAGIDFERVDQLRESIVRRKKPSGD